MGRPAKWRSTRKRVAFGPTTTTMMTIEPDDALVLLPESAHAVERRRLEPSPLDPTTAASKTPQSRSILSGFQKQQMLSGAARSPLVLPLLKCPCQRSSSLRVARMEMKG